MILKTKLIVILLLLAVCSEEKDGTMLKPLMSKPDDKTYVIATPLEGVIYERGEPAENIKITRVLTWNANQDGLVEHFSTDSKGRFSLPLYQDTFKMSSLTQFVANQTLLINYGEATEEPIWISGQMTGELNGETGGAEIKSLVCDLSNELLPVYGENISLLSTKCCWDNIQLEE